MVLLGSQTANFQGKKGMKFTDRLVATSFVQLLLDLKYPITIIDTIVGLKEMSPLCPCLF